MAEPEVTRCLVYWGSHGCDKPTGHEPGDPVHRCGMNDADPCSEMIVLGPEHDDYPGDPNAAVRYALFCAPTPHEGTFVGWSEWMPSRWYT